MADVKFCSYNPNAWWTTVPPPLVPISLQRIMTEMVSVESPVAESRPLSKGDSKICGVCGDKALGYNFNAITCESCKAFFRRNALKKKEFKCPFNDNCKVDVVTRRFCQKCRLKKCFDIGMKKEWIMTDEEKKIKKQKIEENRQKRHLEVHHPHKQNVQQLSPSSVASEESLKSGSSLMMSLTSPSSCDMASSPDALTTLVSPEPPPKIRRCSGDHVDVYCATPQSELSEYDSNHSPCSSITSKDAFSPQTPGLVAQHSPIVVSPPSQTGHSPLHGHDEKATCIDSNCCKSCGCHQREKVTQSVNNVLNVVIKSEFVDPNEVVGNGNGGGTQSSPTPVPSPQDLTKMECAKLKELVVANRAMKSPVHNDPRIMSDTDPSLLNVINMTDIAIRRLIKMSKKINGFKNLCQEDQIALLKGGCTELMILRSVMTYDPEKDCWQGPKTLCIKLEVLREAKGNIYEEHKRFIQSFEPQLRSDENIMLILSAITLFNPDRPNVLEGEKIKVEQDSYYLLLRRYLESLFSADEARSIYIELLQKMEELHNLNENHVRVFLDVNPKDVEPLLIEIFDLKNH